MENDASSNELVGEVEVVEDRRRHSESSQLAQFNVNGVAKHYVHVFHSMLNNVH